MKAKMKVVVRRWQFNNRKHSLVYTKEYEKVMNRIKIIRARHKIVGTTIYDGAVYDILEITEIEK